MAKKLFNYFKHVPDDLVISSTPGVIISVVGTIVLCVLFFFELSAYMTVTTNSELIVDELVDEVLRVNFNVTLHQVPCEYLSVDVTDQTGQNSHNITKDILKWRLDSRQRIRIDSLAEAAAETKEIKAAAESAADAVPEHVKQLAESKLMEDDEEDEPFDTNLSQPLNSETMGPFMAQHELTLVNFFAPWCIWCRRLEPVYLEAASKVPSLHFHGHARLAQVDCVENQAFCGQQMIRAYPTLRMYKDANMKDFELFTGSRTVQDILAFVQQQMTNYKKSHKIVSKRSSAHFEMRRGALVVGGDLYRAKMSQADAQTYCGNNDGCMGFTWAKDPTSSEEIPMIFFKEGKVESAQVNDDEAWSSALKVKKAQKTDSVSGSLAHGPEGCMVAGHLQVRKVPGTVSFVLHSPEHDHEHHLINASHLVNEFWFGDPLMPFERRRLPKADALELESPTSHLLEHLTFASNEAGHSHTHYMKVVTKVLKHVSSALDTIAYKYTVHSNKFAATDGTAPNVEFKYDLSPISIVVHQSRMPTYRFVTSTCAIIGGVFTVIGFLENVIHHVGNSLLKKQI